MRHTLSEPSLHNLERGVICLVDVHFNEAGSCATVIIPSVSYLFSADIHSVAVKTVHP